MKKIMLMSAAFLLASTQLAFANAQVQSEDSYKMGGGVEITSETSAQSDTGSTGGTTESSAGVAIPKFINVTAEAKKADVKADVAAVRAGYNVKANVKARMSMNAQEREEAMEEHKDEMEARWESRKEAMDDWHIQLKARLAAFKDKTKAEIAERIQTNLDALNARLTAHFDAQLETMVSIMVRVAAADVDADATAEIAAANDAITDAQAANDDQADNTYPVSVSSETTVKADVGAARQKLHDDLKKVWDAVKSAREAVRASYDLALGKKV
jgi:hypothetical protein